MASNHCYKSENYAPVNKVYINPNFHPNQPIPTTSVHINPSFSQNINSQQIPVKKPKIHVNPNFVKTTSIPIPSNHTASYYYAIPNKYRPLPTSSHTSEHTHSQYALPIHTSSNYNSVPGSNSKYFYTSSSSDIKTSSMHLAPVSYPDINTQIPHVNKSITSSASIVPKQESGKAVSVSKSRYTLVREKTQNTPHTTDIKLVDKTVPKFKISKYKTVPIDQMIKNIDKPALQAKQKINTGQPSTSMAATQKVKRGNAKIIQSRFKLVKKVGSTTPIKTENKTLSIKRRLSPNTSKFKSKKSGWKFVNKEKFKKNNIPCPLFRKFGKCLRASQGKCDFLHDKKHVSICRKFLQGACHNKDCLLSHELTAKKMPTCYFYLKGMCTKEDCPYLHVKLNDNTKICTDFLNGYCEKGDQCLCRHVNMCPELASKRSCAKRQCPYPHEFKKSYSNRQNVSSKKLTQKHEFKAKKDVETNIKDCKKSIPSDECRPKESTDCRYYKEVMENESNTGIENIKPKRCKLGDLPSFIEL